MCLRSIRPYLPRPRASCGAGPPARALLSGLPPEPFSRPHISPGWDADWLRVKGRVSNLWLNASPEQQRSKCRQRQAPQTPVPTSWASTKTPQLQASQDGRERTDGRVQHGEDARFQLCPKQRPRRRQVCLAVSTTWCSQVACSALRNPPANAGDGRPVPGSGKPLGKERHPTPVFLPGKSHAQRSLASYSPRGHRGPDTTTRQSTCSASAAFLPSGKWVKGGLAPSGKDKNLLQTLCSEEASHCSKRLRTQSCHYWLCDLKQVTQPLRDSL